MFHKKKFKLVERKSDKEKYSAKNKWIRYSVILGLIGFVLLIILANVKSKSYYQNLQVSKARLEAQTSSAFGTLVSGIDITSEMSCSNIACSVTCNGYIYDLKGYLNKQTNCNSMTLAISNYAFPDDQIQSNWLVGSFNLTIIRISKGSLKGIYEGAFDHKTVKYVTELELSDVQLQRLNTNTFTGLTSLKKFALSNKVESFEGNGFLKPMQNTLEKVQIKKETPNAVDPAPWLRGNFKKLVTIVFDGSNLGSNIRNDTFNHLTELSILTMVSCKISTLPDGVFNFMMTHMVVFINLQMNELTNLTGNYLRQVSSLKRVNIQNNHFDCSCKLNELINEYQRYPDGFGDNVTCSSPLSYVGQSLGDIDILNCDDSKTTLTDFTASTATATINISNRSTEDLSNTSPIVTNTSPNMNKTTTTSVITTAETTFQWNTSPSTSNVIHSTSMIPLSTNSWENDYGETIVDLSSSSTDDGITVPLPHTTPSPQNRTTTLSASTIFIECQRYNPGTANSGNVYVELTAPLASFTIIYLSPTSVKLIMDETIDDLALIWFYDQPHTNGSGNNIRIVGEFKVGCQSDVENSLIIEGLSEKRAYTFCIVQEGQDVISPFSCRSYFTSKTANDLNTCHVWLKNEDKALAIGLFIFGIVISLSLGALMTFLVVRAHPVLLKGSKRVIIVNRSTGDVLIMPKPDRKHPFNEPSFRDSYETNTTVPQRRSSAASIQSGLSYMLANNYEDIEYRWKMNVVNDMIYANRIPKSPPPPLPRRASEIAALNKAYCNKIDISVIHTKPNDYGYIP